MGEISKELEVVIGIPGIWKNEIELRESLIKNGEPFFYVGGMLTHILKMYHVIVVFNDKEINICEQFKHLGRGRFDEKNLIELVKHESMVYIVKDILTTEDFIDMLEVGKSLLNSGGLAIKVQTSGISYRKEDWIELCNRDYSTDDELTFANLYTGFINLSSFPDNYSSVGMMSFGHPDVLLGIDEDINEAAFIINNINQYQVLNDRVINTGETFSLDEDSQWYRFNLVDDTRFNPGDSRINPLGIWRMERVIDDK